jgi:hypothetical protein
MIRNEELVEGHRYRIRLDRWGRRGRLLDEYEAVGIFLGSNASGQTFWSFGPHAMPTIFGSRELVDVEETSGRINAPVRRLYGIQREG